MIIGKESAAIFEMFLLVSLSFSAAFIFNENFVDGVAPYTQATANAPPISLNPITVPNVVKTASGNWNPHAFGFAGDITRNGFINSADSSLGFVPSDVGGEFYKYGASGWTQVPAQSVGYTAHSFGLADGSVAKGFISSTTNPNVGILADGTSVAYEGTAWKAASGTGGAGGSGFGSGAGAGTLQGLFGGTFFGNVGPAGAVSALTSGLLWGAIVYGGVTLLGNLFGFDEGEVQAAALGAGAGVATWQTLSFLGQNGILSAESFLVQYSGLIGLGVGVAIFVLTYEKEKVEIVQFTCEPWNPPTGGQNCEKCNEDPLLPCSEYRCKSLGQACEIVNKGTENELCVWVNKNDVLAPDIIPWEEALKPAGLKYVREGGGYKMIKEGAPGGCLEAFTKLEFGVKTSEPAQCRIDLQLKDTFEEMSSLFGNSALYRQEHAQTNIKTLDPTSPDSGVDPAIHNDGTFTFYVRCRDANGNGEDNAAVPFRFCVQKGPDTSQPVVEGLSIPDGSPVRFEVDKVPIELFVNEPAECKWSKRDQAFEGMENTLSCKIDNKFRFNTNLNFVCSGELTGVKDRENNVFYFRCKDKPSSPENERNVMTRSERLTLRGTEPLVIESSGPTGEIRGATSLVEVNLTVETAFGEGEGKATCYYEPEENGQFNIAMLGAKTFSHYQPIPLAQGDYTFYFRCRDSANNEARASTSFKVVVDTEEPLISRVFKDGPNLKIITNEEARCVYSLNGCSYEFESAVQSGLVLSYESSGGSIQKTLHVLPWSKDKTYYIKCEDLQGKRIAPNACNIIVQGAEF